MSYELDRIEELCRERGWSHYKLAKEMNDYFHRHHTPKVKTGTFCNACSLKPLCLPKLCKALRVEDYIRNYIGDKA